VDQKLRATGGLRRAEPLLFAVLPLALVAGAYAYATDGRIVSIDDAYVDTDKVGVSTDIAGTVAEVGVTESSASRPGRFCTGSMSMLHWGTPRVRASSIRIRCS
jgi:hypothetical protein